MFEIDIGNPKYTTFIKLVQVRNFITFELKVIRYEERETQSFDADCFYIINSQPNQRAAPVAHTKSSGLAQLWISTLSFGGKNPTHCFSQISAHTSGAWCHSHTLVSIVI